MKTDSKFVKVNNERSEAIELIKFMDSVAKKNTWEIKSVGGESTINTGERRMFPDIFMYGDNSRTQILQGWEVKMPDVPITDTDFIADAQRKANILGVNSCFVWNYNFGVLYIKNESHSWEKKKEWELRHIKTRTDVETYRTVWENQIESILYELNGFFTSGVLTPARIGDIISDTIFYAIINRNKSLVGTALKSASISNTVIKAYISNWWRTVEAEYRFDETDMYCAYAKYLLLNWINKLTFANLIKGYHNPAALVETITESVSPNAALKIFAEITRKCDFFNVFEAPEYSDILPPITWLDLTDYNAFLSEKGITEIPQETLQTILENSVNQFKRNIVGQFSTPQKLAKILVQAGIDDLTVPCIDPCCGTGTIAKEVLLLKEDAIGIPRAFGTTYASDKGSFPLQISNISMARINAMNLPCLLFKSNVFELKTKNEIQITDPSAGSIVTFKLPLWGSVVSNLPFVAFDQEGREDAQYIQKTIAHVSRETGINLSGRLDLYQAILLDLWRILTDNASVAVITSNSWLGTLAGQEFYRALNQYFIVNSIVASGNGKWFENSDVIALMLFLHKKPQPTAESKDQVIHFGLLHKKLQSLSDADVQQAAHSIKLKESVSSDVLTFKSYSIKQIDELLGMNLALNALFYDIEWMSNIKDVLCPITDFFDVFRGMKTGQDEIYYLRDPNVVDAPYIGRIFKSAKSTDYLIASPDTDAFICNKTIAELKKSGHIKTLQWIDRFTGHLNQSVVNKETFWMNLSNGSFSGSDDVRLFTAMNPERRIFYGLLEKPAKINQRAIGFKPLNKDVNLSLFHALLNSVIGIFYTEATGFPKGLGALDNRAENVESIKILDPRHLTRDQQECIIHAFAPLCRRKILSTDSEYQQADRIAFEHTVLSCFGRDEVFERIKNCVLAMQKVRLSVKNKTTPCPTEENQVNSISS